MLILIPAYNAEPRIANTIKSAIDQTWRRKEMILVDDGSAMGISSKELESSDQGQVSRESEPASYTRSHISANGTDGLRAGRVVRRRKIWFTREVLRLS
jgi:cellulose synthase/poly-beta-1,6-N-acetylglucosamine synthase-like glycosyltransferase